MGLESKFFAKNVNGIKIDAFEKRLKKGDYPGGTGEFTDETELKGDSNWPTFELTNPISAYHYIRFVSGYVAIGDDCGGDPTHLFRVGKILEELTGGDVEIFLEPADIESHIEMQQDEEGRDALENKIIEVLNELNNLSNENGCTQKFAPFEALYIRLMRGERIGKNWLNSFMELGDDALSTFSPETSPNETVRFLIDVVENRRWKERGLVAELSILQSKLMQNTPQ